MCLHCRYLVLRWGQVISLVKPTLLPVPWSFTTGVPLAEESVLSFPLLASQFHGYRDGAGCWFLLFHRPTLCVVLAVFLSVLLRDLSHSLPCSPSHVSRGHCGVWKRVLVLAESLG